MIACFNCQREMEPQGRLYSTVWVKQTKLEHSATLYRCPRCGAKVLDVNRGSERHAEEPYGVEYVLDLSDDTAPKGSVYFDMSEVE